MNINGNKFTILGKISYALWKKTELGLCLSTDRDR